MTELDAALRVLALAEWTRDPDPDDHALLDLCRGATLDIGCGPGRLTKALAERGHLALGIDVLSWVVGEAWARGATAVVRDVFGPLPGEGVWSTALLADGNIGIGGDPVVLLQRARALVADDGRVVVETEPPGTGSRTGWASLQWADCESRPIPWSLVALDDLASLASEAGLEQTHTTTHGDRWFAVLAPR